MAIQTAYDDCQSEEGMQGGKHAILIAELNKAGIRANSREQAESMARMILNGGWRDGE